MFDSSVRHRVSLAKILVPVLIVMAVLFAGASVFADAGTVSLASNKISVTGSDTSKTTFNKGDTIQVQAGFSLADNSSALTKGVWEIRVNADALSEKPTASAVKGAELLGIALDSKTNEYVITYSFDQAPSAGFNINLPVTLKTKAADTDKNDQQMTVTSAVYDGNGQLVGQKATQTYTLKAAADTAAANTAKTAQTQAKDSQSNQTQQTQANAKANVQAAASSDETAAKPLDVDLSGEYAFSHFTGNKTALPNLKYAVKVDQNSNDGLELYDTKGNKIDSSKAYETDQQKTYSDNDAYGGKMSDIGSLRFTKPGTYAFTIYEPASDIQGLWQPGDLMEAVYSKFNNDQPQLFQTSRGVQWTVTVGNDPKGSGYLNVLNAKVKLADQDQDYWIYYTDLDKTSLSSYMSSLVVVLNAGDMFNIPSSMNGTINGDGTKSNGFAAIANTNFLYNYDNQSYSGKATLQNNSQDKSKDSFKDGFFKFTITQDKSDKVQVLGKTGTKTVDAQGSDKGGSFIFDNLPIGKAGYYHFTVKEVDGKVPGYHYDSKTVHLTVTARLAWNFDKYAARTDNDPKDLGLSFKVTTQYDGKDKPGDSLTFNNTYSDPIPANEHFTGKVSLTKDGKVQPFNDGDFTAKITEDAKDKVKAKNVPDGDVAVKGDGTLDFSNITFDQAGDYHFTVHENNGGKDNINYDSNDVDITVHVTYDEAKGAYVAKVTYTKAGKTVDGIVFNNTVKGSKADNTTPGKSNNNANAQNSAKGQNAQNGAKAKSAKTGDTTNTAVWWALIGAAVCAAAGMTLARREQREN